MLLCTVSERTTVSWDRQSDLEYVMPRPARWLYAELHTYSTHPVIGRPESLSITLGQTKYGIADGRGVKCTARRWVHLGFRGNSGSCINYLGGNHFRLFHVDSGDTPSQK